MSRMSWLTLTTGTSRSASFYVVLIFIVGPVYAITPFACAFLLYSIWTGAAWSYTPPTRAVLIWAGLEAIFSVYHHILARRVVDALPRPASNISFVEATIYKVLKVNFRGQGDESLDASDTVISQGEEKVMDERGSTPRLGDICEAMDQLNFHDPRARSFRELMRTWFHKRPWSEIHTHEMRQWLYWCISNAHLPPDHKLSPTHRAALDQGLAIIQKRAGTVLKRGSNSQCRPLLLTLDPVTVHPRPLLFYASLWALNYSATDLLQRFFGVQHGRCGNLEYLVRIPQQHPRTSSNPRPLVFIHGLGLGLIQYSLLLRNLLCMLPTHPILILLQPHISQNIFHPRFFEPLSPEESVHCLAEVIRRMGWEGSGVNVLSHSNGSFFHAWMLKSYPNIIKRSCFVDPVTFCLGEGDLCYNFVYRPIRTGVELIIRYFVGSELGIANVLHRHFDWAANSLWCEEIPQASDPHKTAFVLGGLDEIVNSERVKLYLRSQGVRKGLWFDPKGRHGRSFASGGKCTRLVVTWLLDEA